MTENDRYILELAKASIFSTDVPNPPSDVDWQFIFEKAKQQNILGLLAEPILRLPKQLQPNDSPRWKKVLIDTVYTMDVKHRELDRITEIFKSRNIYPIFLKGVVVKDVYPIPELRTMGDFDIWVEKDQRDVSEHIFIEEGYKVVKDTLYSNVTKSKSNGEIFTSLEDDFRVDPEFWNSELKKNIITDEKGRKILNPTFELGYSIVHAAKHLTREGCGVRNVLDVALLIKKRTAIDFKKAYEICHSQGYELVYRYILTAVKTYFDVSVPEEYIYDLHLTDRFLDYTLSYGVFGRDIEGNVLNKQVARREGDGVSMFRRIFFPPRKMMWHKYQYLKKSPLLTPVAWIHRIFTAVFVKKYSIVSMVKGLGESVEYGNERDRVLDELHLRNI